MDSLALKLSLLLLGAYCAHKSVKSPNRPAQREEQGRFLDEKKRSDKFLIWVATKGAKVFRVRPPLALSRIHTHFKDTVHVLYGGAAGGTRHSRRVDAPNFAPSTCI